MLRIWLKSIRKKDISMLGIKFSSWINLKRHSAPSDSIRASRPRARGRKARRQVSREAYGRDALLESATVRFLRRDSG
jgi:hypothetical protein